MQTASNRASVGRACLSRKSLRTTNGPHDAAIYSIEGTSQPRSLCSFLYASMMVSSSASTRHCGRITKAPARWIFHSQEEMAGRGFFPGWGGIRDHTFGCLGETLRESTQHGLGDFSQGFEGRAGYRKTPWRLRWGHVGSPASVPKPPREHSIARAGGGVESADGEHDPRRVGHRRVGVVS